MMPFTGGIRAWWWLVHKDLIREFRAPRVWPVMIVLGLVLALTIEMQLDLPRSQKHAVVGGLFWLAVFFAGTATLDRSFAGENREGCLAALLQYPVAPTTIYLSKLALNVLAITCLEIFLVPAFCILSDVPLLAQPFRFFGILLVANVGFAAAGTLLSAVTHSHEQRNSLLVLLLLPLASPVMLGAAQATRSLMLGESNEWWRWSQLLACFAVSFVTVGIISFEYVIED